MAKDDAGAERELEQALRLAPTEPMLLHNLATLLAGRGPGTPSASARAEDLYARVRSGGGPLQGQCREEPVSLTSLPNPNPKPQSLDPEP